MKKQPYVVMNLDESTYWLVDDAKSPKDAIDKYCQNCHADVEKEETMSLQAVAIIPQVQFPSYTVTVTPTIKVTTIKY
jgi:hypothetical protein